MHRLLTLGTPWEGSLLGDVLTGEISANDAAGDEGTAQILERSRSYAAENSQGAAAQVSRRFLREWNATQVGVLDTIAVTAIGAGHSIFFADAFGLPWERALTWDPEVFAVVDDALQARTGGIR